jgi:D-tyrosyl-tRNA(Tyr) deacylase
MSRRFIIKLHQMYSRSLDCATGLSNAGQQLVVGAQLSETDPMIGFLQRVSSASIEVDGDCIASIGPGLLVLVGVEKADTEPRAKRLAERILSYRVFADDTGRMNLNVGQISGAVLLVPQFTLAADTRQGNRPGFSLAADPATGEKLFAALAAAMRQLGQIPAEGRFGADMQVSLCNDGPVSFWLQV